jgi:hypothetical protein
MASVYRVRQAKPPGTAVQFAGAQHGGPPFGSHSVAFGGMPPAGRHELAPVMHAHTVGFGLWHDCPAGHGPPHTPASLKAQKSEPASGSRHAHTVGLGCMQTCVPGHVPAHVPASVGPHPGDGGGGDGDGGHPSTAHARHTMSAPIVLIAAQRTTAPLKRGPFMDANG